MKHTKMSSFLRLALIVAMAPLLQNCSGDDGGESDGVSSKLSSEMPKMSFSLVHGDPDDPDYVFVDPDDPDSGPDPVITPDPDDQAGGGTEEPPPGEEPGSGGDDGSGDGGGVAGSDDGSGSGGDGSGDDGSSSGDDDGEVAGPIDGGGGDDGGSGEDPDPSTDPAPGVDLALYCNDNRVKDLVFNFENLGCAGKKDASSLAFSSGQHSLSDLMIQGLEVTALKNAKVNTLFARLGADGNLVIMDEAQEASLRVPSGQSSGLKIKVHPTANLKQGKTYVFKMKLKQSSKLKWHAEKQQCQMTPPHLDVVEVITKN